MRIPVTQGTEKFDVNQDPGIVNPSTDSKNDNCHYKCYGESHGKEHVKRKALRRPWKAVLSPVHTVAEIGDYSLQCAQAFRGANVTCCEEVS